MSNGIELIAQERKEQSQKHGISIEDDVNFNDNGELAEAASHLISVNGDFQFMESDLEMRPEGWGEERYRKMMLKPYKERLIIAGALIAAEIDRLQNFK